MKKVLYGQIKVSELGQFAKIELNVNGHIKTIEYKTKAGLFSESTEALCAAALLPGMINNLPIQLHGKISPQFFESLDEIQAIFHEFRPRLSPVQFLGLTQVDMTPPIERRVGVFFSAGIDSFFTFLKRQDEITDLILVRGFDIPNQEIELLEQVSKVVHQIAESFGKRVLEIESNIRSVLEPQIPWIYGFGPALVSVGHLLSAHFSRLYIAAGHMQDEILPAGSHPRIDPLWSTEHLEFIHDGLEATRLQKIALISEYDLALKTLRVCYLNPNGAYNCCRCEKCLRTMIGLQLVGALERCTTFDEKLDPSRVARLELTNGDARIYAKQNFRALQASGAYPELEAALQTALERPAWKLHLKKSMRKAYARIFPRSRFK